MNNSFKKLYEFAEESAEKLASPALREMFKKCYLNTLETTVKYDEDGNVFVITGDIEAMWLRDSSVQVSHYVRLAGKDEDAKNLVRSLLQRQFCYIIEDPYANAFNESANGKGHRDDETKQNDIVFERKYEIDSLIYPLWLLNRYYHFSKDKTIYDDLFRCAFRTIIDTLVTEQEPHNSEYYFRRSDDGGIDTLDNNGYGSDYGYTGMVRSGFRPSDDRCKYPFLVPSNMFIVAVLKQLLGNPWADVGEYEVKAEKLIYDIENGIQKFAVTETSEFGKIYAYEVDGLENKLLMDDANVPSLLSLPYLGYCSKNDNIYLNTRRFVLSEKNPYYYTGTAAVGVGSPHTPENYIWHISLIIEALTTDDESVTDRIFDTLVNTDAETGFMHESFDCNDPSKYTRSWFAWANTLFAIFILDKIIGDNGEDH